MLYFLLTHPYTPLERGFMEFLRKSYYYETYRTAIKAIEREKELKKWSRKKKEELINSVNPEWNFLNYVDDFRGRRA